ncbi:MAG: alpha/beta hydrolase, partial [Alphaproteobacteria bacterium]|nr:alpha/beta hydrolase [Alphaproteobacteria bacterium]
NKIMDFKKKLENLPELQFYKDLDLDLIISYRYRKEINKDTILFLHGFNGNSKSWAYQFNFFKNKSSVISIDAPGFGKSDSSSIDMDVIADVVVRLLKSLKISKFHVVGHSMGGMLAQILGSKYSNNVGKLVLSCTFKGYNLPKNTPLMEPYQRRIKDRISMSDEEYGRKRIREMLPKRSEDEIFEFLSVISGEISEGSINSGGMAMQYLDTTNYLPSIINKCLIILASEDVVVSKQKSELLIKDIPHANIIELSNVGHAPYCEDAISYNNVLVKFLLK